MSEHINGALCNGSENTTKDYFLLRELRNVTNEKTTLSLQLDEVKRELLKLRAEQCGNNNHGAVGNGFSVRYNQMLERDNKIYQTKLLHSINRERRRDEKRSEVQSTYIQTQVGIDSVRLFSSGLQHAMRVLFSPGRLVLDDGAEVTLDYAQDHIVVRGLPSPRNAFMALLLHAVLKYMENTTQRELNNTHNDTPMALRSTATEGVMFEKDNNNSSNTEQMIRSLQRAYDIERIEREKAQMAQHGAEHECALKEAMLNNERARHLEEKEELEKRIRQLEERKEKKNGSINVNVNDNNHRDVIKRSPSKCDTPIYLCEDGNKNINNKNKNNNNNDEDNDVVMDTAVSRLTCGAFEKKIIILQREVTLLREEKEHLSRQLELISDMTERQRNRLRSVEAATAHLCRNVLNLSEVAKTIKGTTTVSHLFLNPHKHVDKERVRALVESLSTHNNTVHNVTTIVKDGEYCGNDGNFCVERRLADVVALLEIEHRAVREAIEFALHEHNATRQAQWEGTITSEHVNNIGPDNTTASALKMTTLEKENVGLRVEVQRCFEDIKRLTYIIEQSQKKYQELLDKLRTSEQQLREKEETARHTESRYMHELMALREREGLLELRLQQKQKEQQQKLSNPSTILKSAEVDAHHDAHAHLVSTPSSATHTTSTTVLDKGVNIHKYQHSKNNNGVIYGSHNTFGGANTEVMPLTGKEKGKGTSPGETRFSPSKVLLRKNFEKSLHTIYSS